MDAPMCFISVCVLCFICVLIPSVELANVPSSPMPDLVKPCHDPLPVRNGGYVLWGDNFLIEFYCDESFFPLGPVFGSCDPGSRRWSIRTPKCVASGCSVPEAPPNGHVYVEYNVTKATVLCDHGYKLFGPRVRYCNGSVWQGSRPRCRHQFEPGADRLQARDITTTVSPEVLAEEDLKAAALDADNSCYIVYTAPPEIEHAAVQLAYQYNEVRRTWVMFANYTCAEGYRLQDAHRNYLYCKYYDWQAKVKPACEEDLKVPEVRSPCETDNGGCEHTCVPFGGRMYKCDCTKGFVLNRFGRNCDDVDECALFNGHCDQHCHNTPGSFFCTCREGYVASGTHCLDLDECATSTGSLCPGPCVNTPGSYICNCDIAGFQAFGNSCQDVDECEINNGGCEDECRNSHGSYSCHCRQRGYKVSSDGHNCTDVDECVRYKKKVCNHGNCTNTIGSFTCTCDSGYEVNRRGTKCLDVDECRTNNGGCDDVCTNVSGSYVCSCEHPGYTLSATDNTSCTDIDECEEGSGGCEDGCINTEGHYRCVCREPLKVLAPDNRSCTYCLDTEYKNLTTGECESCPSHSHSDPHSASSAADCRCDSGFERTDETNYTCSDVDECASGILQCAFGCRNTPGSASCFCPEGYSVTELNTCEDVDECNMTEMMDTTCNQTCINFPGGYNCSCQAGYLLAADGVSCDDVDECYEGLMNCSHSCVNTHGGAECQCPPGYSLHGNSCLDVDECAAGTHVCEDRCINEEGSYTCDCEDLGYKLSWDLASCVDINECMEGENDCEEGCENTPGSYICTCTEPGYAIDPNDTSRCIDIDECASDHPCKQLCINQMGSFRCDCRPGYALYSANNCAACPLNFYRGAEDPECVRCPRYAITDRTGATSLSDCRCHRSFWGDVTAGEPCQRRT